MYFNLCALLEVAATEEDLSEEAALW